MRAVIAVIALSFASTTAAHACAMRMPEELSLAVAMEELDAEDTTEEDAPVADVEEAPDAAQLVEVEVEDAVEAVDAEASVEAGLDDLLEGLQLEAGEALASAAEDEPQG